MEGSNGNGTNGNGNSHGNGASKEYVFGKPIQGILRDSVAVVFRRRRLIRKAFLWSLLGSLVAILLFAMKYESQMEIVVKPLTRSVPAVTSDSSPRPVLPGDNDAVEEAINSEIEILTSADILEHVVVSCNLQYGPKSWFTPYKIKLYKMIPGYTDTLVPNAVSKLNSDLEVDEVKSSNMLTVVYDSPKADQSNCVVGALNSFWMAKHRAVYRPPQLLGFFTQEANDYRRRLYDAEARLLAFGRDQNAVDAAVQLGIDVTNSNTFLSTMRQQQDMISQTEAQIRADQAQLNTTSPRITTAATNTDNSQLLATLKGDLANLELQRTDLLRKYDSSYPLVQENETQIAQAQAAIAAEDKAPVRGMTTDQNPVYQFLQEDLAKNQSALPAMKAEEAQTARQVGAYHNEALAFNDKAMTQTDLERESKAEESNYLLYLTKREEARISDMLDARNVDNISLSEPPTIAVVPTFAPLLLVILAFLVAAIVGVGVAFIADYLDPSFRTPDEVTDFLNIPVFASIPENGHEAAVPLETVKKNGH